MRSGRLLLLVACARASGYGLDLRVTRGLGPKGYNKTRVSVITQGPASFPDFSFNYSEKFKYRWTKWQDKERFAKQPYVPERWLHSSLIEVPDGGQRVLEIGGQSVTVRLPKSGAGVRGLIISDPCFEPAKSVQHWVGCKWSQHWGTFNKTVTLLNSAMAGDLLDFWMILGDNFYDQNGALTDLVFEQLSLDVKRKISAVVVGNHDMWVGGGPDVGDEYDQHGIGAMQYYALDPAASLHGGFLNFSLDPDKVRKWDSSLNTATNLLWYHMIGDVGFIGVSGAFPEAVLGPHLDDTCAWLGATTPRPNWVFLLGHWDARGSADCNPCPHMDTPSIYRRLRSTPGCQEFGVRLKYQDGHTHCNHVQERDSDSGDALGLMIGASGMSGCSQYGFEYVDSTGGALRLVYFELDNAGGLHRSEEVFQCIQRQGLPNCTHLGTVWFQGDASSGMQARAEQLVV